MTADGPEGLLGLPTTSDGGHLVQAPATAAEIRDRARQICSDIRQLQRKAESLKPHHGVVPEVMVNGTVKAHAVLEASVYDLAAILVRSTQDPAP